MLLIEVIWKCLIDEMNFIVRLYFAFYSYLNNPNSFPSTISKSKRPFGLAGSSPSSAVMVKMAPSEMASWNSVMIAEHPRFGVSFPDILDLNSLSLLVNTGVWSFTSVTLTTNWANVWRELPVVNPKNISRIQSLSGIFYIGSFYEGCILDVLENFWKRYLPNW